MSRRHSRRLGCRWPRRGDGPGGSEGAAARAARERHGARGVRTNDGRETEQDKRADMMHGTGG